MGISKHELFSDYYVDEIETVLNKYAEMSGGGQGSEQSCREFDGEDLDGVFGL